MEENKGKRTLTLVVFIAGLCSIIYELLISTTSSYFLGDSVKQFSLTIGFYMASMGLGSYLSRFIEEKLLLKFILFEILLGLLGGLAVPVLYLAFAYTQYYTFFMFFFIISIGTLIGLEIPLLTRLMETYYSLKVNISKVLSLDYVGALLATLLFPFLLLPFMGNFKTSLIFGLINMSIGFLMLYAFKHALKISEKKLILSSSILLTLFLVSIFFSSEKLLKIWQDRSFEDRVVYAERSPYQEIVLTKDRDDLRLFLNGHLQFSSLDEYRYHEALIHIPAYFVKDLKKVLILGGGDGLGVREVLKYPQIEKIVLVDLDPQVIALGKKNPYLLKINQKSLFDPKLKIIYQDAFLFLKNNQEKFDLIISDLPDPNNVSLARLYSDVFYHLIKNRLSEQGVFVSQATSPYFAKKTFWCIVATFHTANFKSVLPYHVSVPSFGEWGFILASQKELIPHFEKLTVATQFLEAQYANKFFHFDKDIDQVQVKSSSLDQAQVLQYYLSEWKHWN